MGIPNTARVRAGERSSLIKSSLAWPHANARVHADNFAVEIRVLHDVPSERGKIVGNAEAFRKLHAGNQRFTNLFVQAVLQHRGVDETRRDGVDRDPLGAELERE